MILFGVLFVRKRVSEDMKEGTKGGPKAFDIKNESRLGQYCFEELLFPLPGCSFGSKRL